MRSGCTGDDLIPTQKKTSWAGGCWAERVLVSNPWLRGGIVPVGARGLVGFGEVGGGLGMHWARVYVLH